MALSLSELLKEMPDTPQIGAHQVRAAREEAGDHRIYVVLDDDPTGTQSVSDLPILTRWEVEDFIWAFESGKPAVYVMTNSRSLSPADAEKVNREVVFSALAAAKECQAELAFVSRSDSTLRGHFPLEPQTIMDEMEKAGGAPADAIILVPAFGDAGRITVDGIHYAGSEQEGFIPVGETEFAKDATFGYHESSLPRWVAEKTAGKVKAEEVEILKLQDLRGNLANVSQQLEQAQNGQVLVADTVTEEDLRQLALALIKAEAKGKNFVYRVGPPFVRARIGQEVHPPLTREEIATARGERELAAGGLIVVGSHVELTTRQLNRLREEEKPTELEIEVQQIIDPERRDKHLKHVTDQAISAIKNGNVIVRTSRKLVTGVDGDASLEISRQVSAAVVKVTKEILKAAPPRFVVAKGGITSSDTASKGLEIRRAMVIGPMLEGIVSLWTASSGPATGIPYVVFAGNVGNEESLTQVVRKLSHS